MAFISNQIHFDNQQGTESNILCNSEELAFTQTAKYTFDNDVFAKGVKLANENDIQNLQSEIDSILPISNYAYINGDDETSQLGGIPFGTGAINTLIQSPDFLYDNVNKVVKVDNINLATQTQIDTLQSEIDNIPTPNPNVWVNSDGITSNGNRIPFTDGSPNGMTTTQSLTFAIDPQNNPTLTVGGTQMISDNNNNMFLRSANNIETSNNIILKGPASVQTSFQHGTNNSNEYVKTYVDKDNFNFITDNQIGSVTEFKGSSQYDFDNTIYVNGTELTPSNPNALVTSQPLITPSAGAIILSDGINPFGTNTDNNLSYAVVASAPTLTVGNAKIISANNNMVLETTDYILTKKDIYLQGTEDVQRYLTIGLNNVLNNVKTSVNINTQDYICDNQLASKTQWKGASEYTFDNNVNIGDVSTSKTLTLNGVPITPSGGGLSAGLLRALNVNQIVPDVSKTYDIVWSDLTPAEQAIWAGGSEPPIAGSDNSWGFQKLSVGSQKINWTLPFDFLTANLKFQDVLSVYAIIKLNTASNISAEGYLWFEIKSQNIVPDPPNYRTRWNYANSASGVISQLGNTYKIYASDAIPASTAASNTGKGQEPYPLQSRFKSNPVDVEPTSLFSIPFTKFVVSPTGDTSPGYTSAFVQSIALNTASNINSFDFSVYAIGFNDVRYNLKFA
jgi:hypothetical protein